MGGGHTERSRAEAWAPPNLGKDYFLRVCSPPPGGPKPGGDDGWGWGPLGLGAVSIQGLTPMRFVSYMLGLCAVGPGTLCTAISFPSTQATSHGRIQTVAAPTQHPVSMRWKPEVQAPELSEVLLPPLAVQAPW